MPKRPWLPREDAVARGGPYYWWWDLGLMLFDSVVYPALMLVCDLIWFVLSLPLSILGRLVLGRPWRIEAATIGRPRLTREAQARGLRGSREAIEELALAIQSGH
jgi:hypothetical protein